MARTLKSILRAQGRLRKLSPVAIIDIGSNSVRLVVFEGLSRSPTPLFNEKVLCGLGANLATTGRLHEEGVERALNALRRFRVLAQQAGADRIHTLATAAAREAQNGPAFIASAKKILGRKVHVLSGAEEAHYAALGIVCGFDQPVGLSADMGGGSVEFVALKRQPQGEGVSFPFGGLRLQENSGGSIKEARRLIRRSLDKHPMLKETRGQTFYAVGGTWRALGRLHMVRNKYPLSVMHHYEISREEAESLCKRVMQEDRDKMRGIGAISSNRRGLLPYGAALLYEIIRVMQPSTIVFSGTGVREGYLYSLLPGKVQKADPLITAAEEMAVLRSRSPAHARELVKWTKKAFQQLGIAESRSDIRNRKAACMLADITWRSHPDYRGPQALNLLSNANFMGVDHPGRAYIALSSYFRHEGLGSSAQNTPLAHVTPQPIVDKARLMGALFRVAYLLSAAMPGILPKITMRPGADRESLEIVVPKSLSEIYGERLERRLADFQSVAQRPVFWVSE